MPVFEYTAFDGKGRKKEGLIDADSAWNAREKLRSEQIFPVSFKEVSKKGENERAGRLPFSPGITRPDIAVFTRQLSALIRSGFPLVNAINTLMGQTRNISFKRVLSRIKDSIEEGESFAEAVAAFPRQFSDVYVNMVKAGENSGTLSLVLEKLADMTAKQQELNSRIKSVLAYPILMTLICTGVLAFLLTGIVPDIVTIFEDMDSTLPLITRILIDTSDGLKNWWLAGLFFMMVAVGTGMIIGKRPGGRRLFHGFVLKIPLAGVLVQKIAVARLSRTLASLLENGVPLLEALSIVKNITGNVVLKEVMENAATEVEKGQELGGTLKSSPFFPYLAAEMIAVGEQSGNLELMLNETADMYENEVETTVTGLTSLLEPLIILVMGAVVAVIVLAICLPIFEMNQLIQ